MSLQRGINLRALAEKMGQCSGAEVRGICTEAGKLSRYRESRITNLALYSPGMYALRERRQHVTQEDFEFAVAKVCGDEHTIRYHFAYSRFDFAGSEEEPGRKHFSEQVILLDRLSCFQLVHDMFTYDHDYSDASIATETAEDRFTLCTCSMKTVNLRCRTFMFVLW